MVHPRAVGPPVAVTGIALDEFEALDRALLRDAVLEQPARNLCRGVQKTLTGAAASVWEAVVMEAGTVAAAHVQSRDEHPINLAHDVVQLLQGFDRCRYFLVAGACRHRKGSEKYGYDALHGHGARPFLIMAGDDTGGSQSLPAGDAAYARDRLRTYTSYGEVGVNTRPIRVWIR